jgi:hypothetical protein
VSAPEPLYSVDKVAQIFDVSPFTVRGWLRDTTPGTMQGRKVNGQWKVPESEINRIAQREYGSEPHNNVV